MRKFTNYHSCFSLHFSCYFGYCWVKCVWEIYKYIPVHVFTIHWTILMLIKKCIIWNNWQNIMLKWVLCFCCSCFVLFLSFLFLQGKVSSPNAHRLEMTKKSLLKFIRKKKHKQSKQFYSRFLTFFSINDQRNKWNNKYFTKK